MIHVESAENDRKSARFEPAAATLSLLTTRHSTAMSQTGPVRGCISLSPQDAQDIAAILTVGSKVVIR